MGGTQTFVDQKENQKGASTASQFHFVNLIIENSEG